MGHESLFNTFEEESRKSPMNKTTTPSRTFKLKPSYVVENIK